jgi:hypothetical protein
MGGSGAPDPGDLYSVFASIAATVGFAWTNTKTQ